MELYNCLIQREVHLLALIQALNSYRALVIQFPGQYSQSSTSFAWIKYLHQLLDNPSPEALKAAMYALFKHKKVLPMADERTCWLQ